MDFGSQMMMQQQQQQMFTQQQQMFMQQQKMNMAQGIAAAGSTIKQAIKQRGEEEKKECKLVDESTRYDVNDALRNLMELSTDNSSPVSAAVEKTPSECYEEPRRKHKLQQPYVRNYTYTSLKAIEKDRRELVQSLVFRTLEQAIVEVAMLNEMPAELFRRVDEEEGFCVKANLAKWDFAMELRVLVQISGKDILCKNFTLIACSEDVKCISEDITYSDGIHRHETDNVQKYYSKETGDYSMTSYVDNEYKLKGDDIIWRQVEKEIGYVPVIYHAFMDNKQAVLSYTLVPWTKSLAKMGLCGESRSFMVFTLDHWCDYDKRKVYVRYPYVKQDNRRGLYGLYHTTSVGWPDTEPKLRRIIAKFVSLRNRCWDDGEYHYGHPVSSVAEYKEERKLYKNTKL